MASYNKRGLYQKELMRAVFIPVLLIVSQFTYPKSLKREVSSSKNYVCTIERDGRDRRNYSREYRFPFPAQPGESYDMKGSLSYNKYSLLFTQDGNVKITIAEFINNVPVSKTKTKKMNGPPFTLQTSLKLSRNDRVIDYKIQCSPE